MTYLRPAIQALDPTVETAACCTPAWNYSVGPVTIRGKCDSSIPDEVIIDPLGPPLQPSDVVDILTSPVPCVITIDGACI